MKYVHIIKFLLTHDLTQLKECWRAEFTRRKTVSIYRVLISHIRIKSTHKKYLFWWRLAHEMYMYGNKKQKETAWNIQKKLVYKFKIDIHLGAKIGKNLSFPHPYSITVAENVTIGENLIIHQNVTIGCSHEPMHIIIGDNVYIGTNSIILGGEIKIGNNVKIGGMSFINKNIPDNCTVYTQKTNTIILNGFQNGI